MWSIALVHFVYKFIEPKQKLAKVMPLTMGQASRISGVNPADIAVLAVYLETRKRNQNN